MYLRLFPPLTFISPVSYPRKSVSVFHMIEGKLFQQNLAVDTFPVSFKYSIHKISLSILFVHHSIINNIKNDSIYAQIEGIRYVESFFR